MLSLIPFVVVFEGILGLQLSSKYVAPAGACQELSIMLCAQGAVVYVGCLVAILLGTLFFQDSSEFLNDDLAKIMGKVRGECCGEFKR